MCALTLPTPHLPPETAACYNICRWLRRLQLPCRSRLQYAMLCCEALPTKLSCRTALQSHGRALLSHGRALLSHGRALLSNGRALLSHGRALLSNGRALLSHAELFGGNSITSPCRNAERGIPMRWEVEPPLKLSRCARSTVTNQTGVALARGALCHSRSRRNGRARITHATREGDLDPSRERSLGAHEHLVDKAN